MFPDDSHELLVLICVGDQVLFLATFDYWSVVILVILWKFNIAIENHHFSIGKPSISMGHFP